MDTLSLARSKFPGSLVSLDALCKRYRIDNSKRVHHTALIDCDLLAKVYINLIDQKEPTLNFQNLKNEDSKIDIQKPSYFKRIVEPTIKEKDTHSQYIKSSLKKNFF